MSLSVLIPEQKGAGVRLAGLHYVLDRRDHRVLDDNDSLVEAGE